MKIKEGPNPNCSEAIFRFYTLDTKKMQKIIKAISVSTDGKPPEIVPEKSSPEDYEGTNFGHKGKIKVQKNKGAFIVRCRNNYLLDHFTRVVMDMGVPVEEGESSQELYRNHATDCTCGIKWFSGYEKQLSEPMTKLEKEIIERSCDNDEI